MKFHYLLLASLVFLTLLSGCKTDYMDDADDAYSYNHPSDYQATSRSYYPNPQAYDTTYNSSTRQARASSSGSSSMELPYEDGHNAVKSSFGSGDSATNTSPSSPAATTQPAVSQAN